MLVIAVLATIGVCGPFAHAIIGGFDTSIEKYPYLAALEVSETQRCGGSIINEKWILTGASCVRAVTDSKTLRVRVGSTKRQDGGALYSVSTILINPNFNRTTHESDMALLNLEDTVTFSDTVKPVTLAAAGQTVERGKKMVVTGWGSVDKYDTTEYATVLQAARIPVVGQDLCNLVFPDKINTTMLCAGVAGKDACKHDAGDPLVDDAGVQFGIVSWGHSVCDSWGFPGVYTNIADPEMRQWIQTHTSV